MAGKSEIATLGGGCFWCLEAVYDQLKGVESVESGYTAGHVANPSYKLVCTGTTGHNESVQITFDPNIITFEDILDVFFTIHDPTTLNRQGNDVGTQYRSGIYYHDETQKATAEKTIAKFNAEHLWSNPIVTEVKPFDRFYVAEDYHQEYFAHNGNQPYCRAVIAPKVSKFRKHFLDRLKA
jgi:peptide-methionine (S)-S-oxide reductase